MLHRIIALSLWTACLLTRLNAQEPLGERKTALLPPDDPYLYQSFLHFHDGLSAVLQEKRAKDPVLGARVERGVARDYGIKLEDLQKVTDTAHALTADLASWQSEVKSQVEQARSKNERADPETMRMLYEKRRQLVEAARQRLSTDLSPESWAALHAYINNVHRQHVTVMNSKSPVAAQRQ